METGPALTTSSVWLALLAYFAATGLAPDGDGARVNGREFRWRRAVWSVGCLFYLVHVTAAFEFHHAWSHAAAVEHTAQLTADVVGWSWGGGIWFNHLFTLAWMADVGWMWLRPAGWLNQPRRFKRAWQGFFFFMVFNATVVFADGAVRWFGLAGCAWIAFRWLKRKSP
jgi:hypothetical protein